MVKYKKLEKIIENLVYIFVDKRVWLCYTTTCYAIIETGGKQYKVSEGDIITVEKLGVEAGSEYTFENVLAVNNGEKLTVGTPVVAGASVVASVIGDGKAKKVIVYKYKPKKTFHKKNGHRQPFTKLKIEKING